MAKGRYSIASNAEYVNYSGDKPVVLGYLVDTTTNKNVMLIIYNKGYCVQTGNHMTVDIYDSENEEIPGVTIGNYFKPCLYEQTDVFLSFMLHEYGHYINGDLLRENMTSETVAEERLNLIYNNRVQESEKRADAFAVHHIGKSTVMRGLDYMIKKRKERFEDPELKALAIREFELRKRAIRNM